MGIGQSRRPCALEHIAPPVLSGVGVRTATDIPKWMICHQTPHTMAKASQIVFDWLKYEYEVM